MPRVVQGGYYNRALQYEIMAGDVLIGKKLKYFYYRNAISLLKKVRRGKGSIARANHVLGHIYSNKDFRGFNLKLAVKHYTIAAELGLTDADLCRDQLARK